MLWAYFDDSGTHAASEITTLGGLVGTDADWAALEADWCAVIDDFREHGLQAFHAADCERGGGDFAQIQKPIREAIARRFARVTAKHTNLRPFWSSVINEDWEAVAVPDPDFIERYEKPLGLCFEWIVQQVDSWSERYMSGQPIALIFSEQKDYEDRMREIFSLYSESKHYARLKSITFGSYRDIVPLQAADQLATEMTRYWRASEYDLGKFKRRPEIEHLGSGRGLSLGGCYDRGVLENAVKQYQAGLKAWGAGGSMISADDWAKIVGKRPPS